MLGANTTGSELFLHANASQDLVLSLTQIGDLSLVERFLMLLLLIGELFPYAELISLIQDGFQLEQHGFYKNATWT